MSTDWIPASTDPEHVGWYECRYFDGDMPEKLWFDGSMWRYGPDEDVTDFGNMGDELEREAWRGVASAAANA